ncbi:MAG TPA: FtsX-like permease family protein [Steroidobacteraceae bacterium]|nr:FtsX-like permease family protein [Steroidobacteraceae bacterium]
MNFLRQFLGVLSVNLSGITQRIAPVLTIIVGVACAVGVLVSMLAMGTGARRQEMGNVRADRVILTTAGARVWQSAISRDEAGAILAMPGILKGAQGEPIVVAESEVFIEGRRRVLGNRIYFPLIGTTPTVTEYLPEMRFTDGRMFKRGLHELIAGNPCARQFTDFGIGDRRVIHGADWTVVGHFDLGQVQQCVVYADVDGILSAFSRNTYSSVSVRLQSPSDFDAFRDAVNANPTLHLDAHREREIMEEGFKELNAILNFVSYFVGTIMAIAATLGAVNSLYAIVDSRRREVATLRAIGFGSAAVVASILCESILWAVPGALLGCALAWAFFNGLSASPFGYSFQLAVTPSLAVLGIGWALAMGLVGGIFPALRASRVPVTTALRAV